MCKDCEGCRNFLADVIMFSEGACAAFPNQRHSVWAFTRCPWPELRREKPVTLKPCPFCGAVPEGRYTGIGEQVLANIVHNHGCYFRTLFYGPLGLHCVSEIKQWNKRA